MTTRKQLAENYWSKILRRKTRRKKKTISSKYSVKFVIIPCYEVLNLSQAAACDGNFYQISLEGDSSNPPP